MRNTVKNERVSRRIRTSGCALSLLLFLITWPTLAQAAQGRNIDPWEVFNRPVFHFNKVVDGLLVKPVALAYRQYVPGVAKTGVRNFFNNLDDVNVLANDLLQGKFAAAVNDGGRLLLNSTLGVCGLFDVASKGGLNKNYEDFGQTLGYWGVGDGGYLMLPILGASTLRDAVGSIPDYLLNPLRLINDRPVRASLFALDIVDTRVAYLPAEEMIRGDEYSFVRNAYMQRREYLVADGQLEDEFDDF